MSELNRILERKFKNVSNKKLVSTLNRRYKNGLNDDDYVGELFRRAKKQNFKVIPKYDTYEIDEKEEYNWKD
jgi:hypothetical protein